jgi:Protein-L-isoaspartate(D-aspartate) O-methyltransferase (PCMT)
MEKRATELQQASSPAALVRDLIEKGIYDKRLLDAFTQIRRVDFIPGELAGEAYSDEPVSIGHGQVTTQPSLIALMVQAASLDRNWESSRDRHRLWFSNGDSLKTVPAGLLNRKIG